MAVVANMATYPGRMAQSVEAIRSIAGQVDVINLVLNEYDIVPSEMKALPRINFIVPPTDLKDVGKFLPPVDPHDDIFLCDDDIIYPPDYMTRMIELRSRLAHLSPVLGLHGVIYSDYYEGKSLTGRLVDVFHRKMETPRLVNQLGTGTVHCKGSQLPDMAFMKGSQNYVDVRFARHALISGFPMICVPRVEGWLRQIEVETSIYDSFTESLPIDVVREIQGIAGHIHLDPDLAADLENLLAEPG